MSTAEMYYRQVNCLTVHEHPILGREHHKVIELLEDYHRGMTQVKNNDLLHSVNVSLLPEAMEVIDDYLNAGCKESRKETSKKAKKLYEKYTGEKYKNSNER